LHCKQLGNIRQK